MASLSQRVAAGAAWMVAWRIVTRILGLASTLVLARVLAPADFGLLAMATTLAAAVEAMSQLGLQDALVRHRESERLLDTGFTLQLGRSIVTALMVSLVAPAAAWWFAEPRLVYVLLVLAVSSLVGGIENIGIVGFRREMRFDKQFGLLLLPRLLQVAVTVPLALSLQNYWALLAGIVVTRLARTVMTYAVHPYRPRLSLSGWRELAGFSFWTWMGALAGLVWDRCDPFILGPGLGASRLGIYLQAAELAALPVTELVVPAVDALLAGLSSAHRQGPASVRLAPLVALSLLVGILPLIITISCGAGYVVTVLLGPQWKMAQGIVAILAWQGLFAPFGFVVGVTFVANGLVRRNFVANVAASAIKSLCLVVVVSLTRRLDLVALATVCCVACEAAVFLALLPRDQEWPSNDLVSGFGRAMLATGVTVLVLWWLGLAWEEVTMSGLPALGYGVLTEGLAFAVFTAALLATWLGAGKPDGAERLLFRLARDVLRSRSNAVKRP